MKSAPKKIAIHPAPGGSMRIPRAHGMAHSHGCGGANPKRDHISKAGDIQGNLVSGKLHGAQLADEKSRHGKSADFQ